jgi:hypothetical protein
MSDRLFHKRDKLADVLFDLAKYLLTAVVIGGIFLGEDTGNVRVLSGLGLSLLILAIAAYVTPWKE